MTWIKLYRAPSQARIDALNVRITASGYEGVPNLVIRIAREYAAQGGILADEKSRVDTYLGAGADAGRMLIRPDPKGERTCHPRGMTGTLRLAFRAPDGMPREWPATDVEAQVESESGISFKLPWHKPAGEREVGEDTAPVQGGKAAKAKREATRPKPQKVADKIKRGLQEALAVTRGEAEPARVHVHQVRPEPAPKPLPPTLDAVEETARPLESDFVGERMTEEELLKGLDRLFDEDDKPVNGTAGGHVYADSPSGAKTIAFHHKGKSVDLEEREHAVMSRLYKATLKSPGAFLDFGVLSKAAGTKDIDILHVVMTRGTEKVKVLGLIVGVKKKLGYWMKEAAEAVQT